MLMRLTLACLTTVSQPPKELFIEVRAVKDCGELLTYYGLLKLDIDTTHFVRRFVIVICVFMASLNHLCALCSFFNCRSDVEHLIRQGNLVQVTAETGV